MAKYLILAAIALTLGGCFHKGAKVVEGTDLAVGINVPGSEGTLQLQLFNYLSGFRLGIDRNAKLTMTYSVAETNSFLFGAFSWGSAKGIEATVDPCSASTNTVIKAD
jgi:hypothetical protein